MCFSLVVDFIIRVIPILWDPYIPLRCLLQHQIEAQAGNHLTPLHWPFSLALAVRNINGKPQPLSPLLL